MAFLQNSQLRYPLGKTPVSGEKTLQQMALCREIEVEQKDSSDMPL